MIDFIDPTLKRSEDSKKFIDRYPIRPFLVGLSIVVMLGMTAWLIYIVETSKVDTAPRRTIDVDKSIENLQIDGRIPSIENTLE